MIRFLPAVIFLFSSLHTFSQPYGNEWINYDQKYVRMDITETALYRIDHTALSEIITSTGSSLSSIDPRNFQIFHNGSEQYIHIEGESDGEFDLSDFIEFFGIKNDGSVDAGLYNNPDEQLQTYTSLYTDTSAYFLTWNTSTSNKRQTLLDNTLTSLPSAEQYCKYQSLYLWGAPYGSAKYCPGKVVFNELYHSTYGPGEGFTSETYSNSNYPITISTPHIYTGTSFTPTFATAIITTNITEHFVEVDLNGLNIIDTTLYNALTLKYNLNISVSDLLETNTIYYKSLAGAIDKQRYAYARIIYPRQYNFDNVSRTQFTLSPVSSSEKYLEVSNFDEKSTSPVMYDLTDNKRMIAVVESDISKFHLEYDAKNHEVYISSQDVSDIKSITSYTPVTFIDFHDETNQGDYLIISHPALYSDDAGINWVENYREYRGSLAGGNYVSKIINVQQLYDQFSYGIKKHPLAIRNFALFAKDSFELDPKYVFLIGKSYTYDLTRPTDSDLNEWGLNYVPTFGFPGSDNLLMCRQGSLAPEISIGRLTTNQPDDVRKYYEKVVEYEAVQANTTQTVENKAWMKNVLHFAGGFTDYEQDLFDDYLTNYGIIIKDTLYGAHVQQFNKTTTDPILYSSTEYLDSIVNAGVSLMTFFGHAAASTFDYNIGQPEDFDNFGKYFVVFSNGCNTAAIHGYDVTLTEEFVLEEDKAAVGFIAASTFSVASSLYTYGQIFYNELADKSYLYGLGDMLKATNDSIDGTGDLGLQLTTEHTTLQGDPALRLNSHSKPDYAIEAPYVFFDPPLLSTAIDSFTMNIVVSNLGMAIDTSYFVEVVRHKPGGTTTTYFNQFDATYFRDTLKIKFFTDPDAGVGENIFDIHIDNTEFITELDEYNNILSVNAYVISNDAIPIYPFDFALMNHAPEYLAASTADVFAAEKQFVMQIDTTKNFNSPILQTTNVTESGGVIKWNSPPISWLDSVVYYWRISLDTLYDNEFIWRYHSFIHKPGLETGWNQSHYFQYQYDNLTNILLKPSREFEFVTDYQTYYLHTGFDVEWFETYSLKNSELIATASCVGEGFLMFIIDDATGETIETYDIGGVGSDIDTGPFGDTYCSESWVTRPYQQFYTNNTEDRLDLYNFLNSVEDSSTIIIYNYGDPHFYDWADDEVSAGFNLMDVFESYGASGAMAAADVEEGRGYIMRTKKGNPSTTIEVIGLPGEIIDAEFLVSEFWYTGDLETPLIGPASAWDKIKWKLSTEDTLPTDINSIDVIGISPAGLDFNVYEGLTSFDTSIAGLSATEFPFIKLRLNTRDDTLRTPTQVDYLRAIYSPVPECALNPNIQYSISTDSLQQGDVVSMSIAITNVSELAMDSLLISYSIIGQNNIEYAIPYPKLDSLLSNETMISNLQFNTRDYPPGMNILFVEVNPDNDQPEQYHFNNLGFIPLYVQPDFANPLLDVTFDGIHILDGDIVSAEPEIMIQLKDENIFLALDDTSYINVQLKHPDGTITDHSYDDITLKFFPADTSNLLGNNTAKVQFLPGKLTDGVYELLVNGEDVSGNDAGETIDYSISFEVINKPMLSNVFNYPNPFTTQTRFVFTLTGSEIPEYFKIQVMTISGKVIREIMRNELGELHIGTNITEFAWDGTDRYGDPVANGLYLYRVVARLEGKELEKYETNTDTYFNNGWGKMYLAR
ncbi:MAG: C25 family cysteine peptidase [Chitinophagales bacterium]